MEAIFSPQGHLVGWLKNDGVYDEAGYPRAFVRGKDVFALNGDYLGRVEHGYFRDQRGDAVAFMRGATGSPIAPTPRVIPAAPMTWAMPNVPTPRVVPYGASASPRWSLTDWEIYLGSSAAAEPVGSLYY
jgi:hypothetical protein